MALEPGDKIPEEGCHEVGNFPFDVLTNPESLTIVNTQRSGTVPLAALKETYIEEFEAQDIEVCEETRPFANIHTPLMVNVQRPEEEEEEPEDPDQDTYILVARLVYSFKVVATCSAGYCFDTMFHYRNDGTPYEEKTTYWTSDIGPMSFTFDMSNMPLGGHHYYEPSCECLCNNPYTARFDILSDWVFNPDYPYATGGNPRGEFYLNGVLAPNPFLPGVISATGGQACGDEAKLNAVLTCNGAIQVGSKRVMLRYDWNKLIAGGDNITPDGETPQVINVPKPPGYWP